MTRRDFALAPMSAGIRWLTILLLLLPPGFAIAALAGVDALAVPAALLAFLYFAVWFVARPARFEVSRRGIDVVFPAWRRAVPARDGLRARPLALKQFREEFGLPLRIGVGGLWGGFGWLWTSRRGIVEFYISRASGFVLVERDRGRALLVTPERPAAFMEALAELAPPG